MRYTAENHQGGRIVCVVEARPMEERSLQELALLAYMLSRYQDQPNSGGLFFREISQCSTGIELVWAGHLAGGVAVGQKDKKVEATVNLHGKGAEVKLEAQGGAIYPHKYTAAGVGNTESFHQVLEIWSEWRCRFDYGYNQEEGSLEERMAELTEKELTRVLTIVGVPANLNPWLEVRKVERFEKDLHTKIGNYWSGVAQDKRHFYEVGQKSEPEPFMSGKVTHAGQTRILNCAVFFPHGDGGMISIDPYDKMARKEAEQMVGEIAKRRGTIEIKGIVYEVRGQEKRVLDLLLKKA